MDIKAVNGFSEQNFDAFQLSGMNPAMMFIYKFGEYMVDQYMQIAEIKSFLSSKYLEAGSVLEIFNAIGKKNRHKYFWVFSLLVGAGFHMSTS